MSKKFPNPIFVKIWSSSHGCPWHGLPQALNDQMKEHPKFQPPRFDAVSGRRICDDVVASIKTDMNSRSGNQVHVIFLGGNNIRKRGKPADIIPFFRSILEYAKVIPGCYVCILGLLPSPGTDDFSKEQFGKATTMLKKLSQRYLDSCSFLNISRIVLVKDVTINGRNNCGVIDRSFYKPGGIHLNSIGSGRIAQAICTRLISIPNKHFV